MIYFNSRYRDILTISTVQTIPMYEQVLVIGVVLNNNYNGTPAPGLKHDPHSTPFQPLVTCEGQLKRLLFAIRDLPTFSHRLVLGTDLQCFLGTDLQDDF